MIESAVRIVVDKIIAMHNLAAEIIELELDEVHWTVTIEVERQDYERAILLDNYFPGYSIRWCQKTPSLVEAEVGDLVLIYDNYHAKDHESSIGLVSSKYVEENGDVCYGCRYFKVGLGDRFVDTLYNFELTAEDYGGFPKGFLRVLSQQEALTHLSNQLSVALELELERLKTRFARSSEDLPKTIASLGKFKKVKCDKIELDDLPYGLSLKT